MLVLKSGWEVGKAANSSSKQLFWVEKSVLVISSLIPSDLILLLYPFHTTKFLQEASVDF